MLIETIESTNSVSSKARLKLKSFLEYENGKKGVPLLGFKLTPNLKLSYP